LIPPAYVPAVLAAASAPGGLTPRFLWSTICTTLRGEPGHENSCASFLDWCRVAVSHGVGPANPLRHLPPVMVLPDARLGAQRAEILRADLPERFLAPAANLRTHWYAWD
jgi:hypothetical protein